MLKPCQYRNVNDDGQLICAKITRGDHEVTPEICAACPVAEIDCRHLRFSLERQDSGAIIVRYGNGRTEVWDGEPAGVRLQRAACFVLSIPVSGTHTCAGCALRSPMNAPEAQVAPGRGPAAIAKAGKAKVIVMPDRQEQCATH